MPRAALITLARRGDTEEDEKTAEYAPGDILLRREDYAVVAPADATSHARFITPAADADILLYRCDDGAMPRTFIDILLFMPRLFSYNIRNIVIPDTSAKKKSAR